MPLSEEEKSACQDIEFTGYMKEAVQQPPASWKLNLYTTTMRTAHGAFVQSQRGSSLAFECLPRVFTVSSTTTTFPEKGGR